MEEHSTEAIFLFEALVLLIGAVIAVPLFKKFQLGSVLGYLAAGVIIGPVLQLVTDGEAILHFAEFGIVLLLFVIGLELRPALLWRMRTQIFGLGTFQMLLTGLALTGILDFLGYNWRASIVIGFGLALSSTAFALQVLEERNELHTPHGQKGFAVLLFQDLAIVPLIAMIAFLAPWANESNGMKWEDVGIAVGAVVLLVVLGRYVLNWIFRILANADAREIMTAAALLVVIGAAVLMEVAGLSMAMGAFLAGVLLAESSFRHQLEADIEPFRGLLLGLFFMAVGLSLDLEVVRDSWLLILTAAPVMMIVKILVLYGVARLFRASHENALKIAFLLPQAGEFGFVLFSQANDVFLISSTQASQLTAIVTLSMALTPLSVFLCSRYLLPKPKDDEMEEDFDGAESSVFVIGFGRFGQVAGQLLLAEGVDATLIDNNAERIREARRFGFKIYYGDGRRPDVLRAAGATDAELLIVCVDGRDNTDAVIAAARAVCPVAKLYVRSYDRRHTLDLWSDDIDHEVRETYESAIALGAMALEGLGLDPDRVTEVVADVRRRDRERLELQQVDGQYAGVDMIFKRTVHPEPLVEPKRAAEALTEETKALTEEEEEPDAETKRKKPAPEETS